MTTQALIDELTKLDAEMTPGPWRHGFDDESGTADDDDGGWITGAEEIPVVKGGHDGWSVALGVAKAEDGDGIAALRSLVPSLIAFAKRASAIEEAARELFEAKADETKDMEQYVARYEAAEAALAAALSPEPSQPEK